MASHVASDRNNSSSEGHVLTDYTNAAELFVDEAILAADLLRQYSPEPSRG